MYDIFERNFEDIDSSDIIQLVEERKERENLNLEYKYKIEDDLINDICAFANSQGGYIIIGVEEDKELGDGHPSKITGVKDPKYIEDSIREQIRENINPALLGWKSKVVSIRNLYIIIIFIPNSSQKPHFVKHKKYHPFPVRLNRSRNFWSMSDVKNIILTRSFAVDRLEAAINSRIRIFQKTFLVEPAILLLGLPTFFGDERVNIDDPILQELILHPPLLVDSQRNMPSIDVRAPKQYCLEGIELRGSNQTVFRLHRTGILEFMEKLRQFPDNPRVFNGPLITKYILDFCNCYSEINKYIQNFDPITICVFISGTQNTGITTYQSTIAAYDVDIFNWKEEELAIKVTFPSAFDQNLGYQMADRLFQAYSFDKCPRFFDRK